MPKVMNANFEALAHKFHPQLRRHSVIPFRNKVERRSEAQFTLEFSQLSAFPQAGGPFDVVSKDKCELLSAWPPAPSIGLPLRTRHDWPAIRKSLSQSYSESPPKCGAQRPR